MNLGVLDAGQYGIERIHGLAQDAALQLAALAEQDKVMSRKKGVDDLLNDGVVVSDNPGKDRFAFLQARDQVHADFVFDRPAPDGLFRESAAATQRDQGFWQ